MADVAQVRAEIDAAVAGQTVSSRFAEAVEQYGDRVALRWKLPDESWGEWTFREYGERATRVAEALAAFGVGRGDVVALMMRNRPEFHVADIGTLLAGGTPVSIYNSNSSEQVQYVADHCQAKVAIVEDEGFLDRFLAVRDALPKLERIVVIEPPANLADGVVPFAELLAHEPGDLATLSRAAEPDDLATIIYTSGTTGPPKGVMLTHRNVVWTVESFQRRLDRETEGWRTISYLPMAHVAERVITHYLGFMGGEEVTTCPDPGLIASYLGAVRPHSIFGVPRVWEKIQSGVAAALSADKERAQKFNEAVDAARPLVAARDAGKELSDQERETLEFLDAVAFLPVRQLLGLDEAIIVSSGAAPIPVELIEWYRTLGIPLAEGYGLSENTAILTVEIDHPRPGTVGRPIPGVELKLDADGEILVRGGNVFAGYLNDPEKTAEAIDADGWLHTGDIGEVDDDGFVRIVDRKKELIITAGGKNVSPANLEAALKATPLIGQAAVIGDGRPFVSALLVLDPDFARSWAAEKGIEFSSLAELATHPEMESAIADAVAQANERFSQAERVKRWVVLGEEWMPDSVELTPTMKLKRRGINEKYAAEIDSIYS